MPDGKPFGFPCPATPPRASGRVGEWRTGRNGRMGDCAWGALLHYIEHLEAPVRSGVLEDHWISGGQTQIVEHRGGDQHSIRGIAMLPIELCAPHQDLTVEVNDPQPRL